MSLDVVGELPDGRPVRRLRLGEEPGLVLDVLDLGATVQRLEVTCGDGIRRNVALGHPSPADYLASTDHMGGTIGRYANRIGGARFTLDGSEVVLGDNDRGHHLHGGTDGFDRRQWRIDDHGPSYAVLSMTSRDGDQGFPGEVEAAARFEVGADTVRIELSATTSAPTVVNLTSHAYLNLDGDGAGTIDDHVLEVAADTYTPVDDTGIPLGDHRDVAGTPFDFRRASPLGPALRSSHPQVVGARGIDHNFVLRGSGLRDAAVLESPRTRTRLVLRTDQPGLQVYTGNELDGARVSTEGGRYRRGDGIALEPQLFPDSPNRPDFPSPLLRPGETYRARLAWELGTLET